MKVSEIFVATDLSEVSASAARWAQNVKPVFGATITVAHVVEASVSNWFSSAMDTFEDQARVDKAKDNIRAWYRDATGFEPDHVDIRMGSAAAQLTAIVGADKSHALLVMAQTGKGALGRFFLGSTVARVAATPPCPLVVVHPEHEALEPGHTVVVGTDFSPNAELAVNAAADLANTLSAPLHILHANPAPPVIVFDGADVPVETLQATALDWSKNAMNDLVGRLTQHADLQISTSISAELPALALASTVNEKNGGLLVVGHSGESELMQHVLGSTAQRCLTEMPTTLVIVPRVA